ncbi:hypothetical protein J1614_000184 [Plenodomus biglobosus]|nr:hypothetical protein J1614_000184 [Plenodomus biglobosus]
MDLVQTVRKEGSRGGRADFKWEDVKNDAHRENYLGHSLMAPVGRWQQGRDLSWYAKGDDDSKAAEAARIAEEKRKIKQAEEDAMLVAMGLPVPERDNANLTPLGNKVDEAKGDEHPPSKDDDQKERSQRRRHDHGEKKRRHRSKSPAHHRERRHRHRHRSSSRDRPRHDRTDRHRHRSRSREHRRSDDRSDRPRERGPDRKRSPSPSREQRRRRDTRSRSPYANDRRRD